MNSYLKKISKKYERHSKEQRLIQEENTEQKDTKADQNQHFPLQLRSTTDHIPTIKKLIINIQRQKVQNNSTDNQSLLSNSNKSTSTLIQQSIAQGNQQQLCQIFLLNGEIRTLKTLINNKQISKEVIEQNQYLKELWEDVHERYQKGSKERANRNLNRNKSDKDAPRKQHTSSEQSVMITALKSKLSPAMCQKLDLIVSTIRNGLKKHQKIFKVLILVLGIVLIGYFGKKHHQKLIRVFKQIFNV